MSLDSVELIFAIEREFDITIDNQEAEQLQTVDDLYRCVLRLLPGAAGGDPPEVDVWRRLVEVIVDEIGVEPERVHPGAYIVEDLGID